MGAALDETKVGRQFDTWLRNELADELPCAYHECDAEAEWRMIMPCCNNGVDLCEPHKVVQDETLALAKSATCVLCGTKRVRVGGIRFTLI